MLQSVKESVHRMTSHLQLISGYLEMEDYIKALSKTKETMKEMHALSVSLAGLANMRMTVPKDGAVVVPHGSTVVSYEDVNVDVGRNEVRSVDKNEIRAGYGNENPKTKGIRPVASETPICNILPHSRPSKHTLSANVRPK